MLLSIAVGAFGLNFENSLGFFVGILAIVFYAAGNFWAKSKFTIGGWGAFACFVISGAAFFLCGEMDVHTMTFPNYPLNVLGALTGTLLLHWLLGKIRAEKFSKALSFCGRWSLLLLGVHYAEFMLFDWNAKISGPAAVAVLRLAVDVLATFGLSKIPIAKKIFCAETQTKVG